MIFHRDLSIVAITVGGDGQSSSGGLPSSGVLLTESDKEKLLRAPNPESAVQEILEHNHVQNASSLVLPMQIMQGNGTNNYPFASVASNRTSIRVERTESALASSEVPNVRPINESQIINDRDTRNSSSNVEDTREVLIELRAAQSTPKNNVENSEGNELQSPPSSEENRVMEAASQSNRSVDSREISSSEQVTSGSTMSNSAQGGSAPVSVAREGVGNNSSAPASRPSSPRTAAAGRTLEPLVQNSTEVSAASSGGGLSFRTGNEDVDGVQGAILPAVMNSTTRGRNTAEARNTNLSSEPGILSTAPSANLAQNTSMEGPRAVTSSPTINSENQGTRVGSQTSLTQEALSAVLDSLGSSMASLPISSMLRGGNQTGARSAEETNSGFVPSPVDDTSAVPTIGIAGNSTDERAMPLALDLDGVAPAPIPEPDTIEENIPGFEIAAASEPISESGAGADIEQDILDQVEEMEIGMANTPAAQELDVDDLESERIDAESPDDDLLENQIPLAMLPAEPLAASPSLGGLDESPGILGGGHKTPTSSVAPSPAPEGIGVNDEDLDMLEEGLGESPQPFILFGNGEPLLDEDTIQTAADEEKAVIPASAPLDDEDLEGDIQDNGTSMSPSLFNALGNVPVVDTAESDDLEEDAEFIAPESNPVFEQALLLSAMEEGDVRRVLESGMGFEPQGAPGPVGAEDDDDQIVEGDPPSSQFTISTRKDVASPDAEISSEADLDENGSPGSESPANDADSIGLVELNEEAIPPEPDNILQAGKPSQGQDTGRNSAEASSPISEEGDLVGEAILLVPDAGPIPLTVLPEDDPSEGVFEIPDIEMSSSIVAAASPVLQQPTNSRRRQRKRRSSESDTGEQGSVELLCSQDEGNTDEMKSSQCNLCSCLDDPTSRKCRAEASTTCGTFEGRIDTCVLLAENLISGQPSDYQDAALVFRSSCPGLDVSNADFCSCTVDFDTAECRAGMLQLCETNEDVCEDVFDAMSDIDGRDRFINRLVGEGSCGVGDSMVLLDIVLQDMSTDRFTPLLARTLSNVIADTIGIQWEMWIVQTANKTV